MKVNTGKLGPGKGDGNGIVEDYDELDLNEIKEKCLSYIFNPLPSSDRRGHSAILHVRLRPIQLDIMEAIRDALPKNLWQTQSDQLRSMIALGCVVITHVLKHSKAHGDLVIEQKLMRLLNFAQKKARRAELAEEVRQVMRDINAHGYPDLEKVVRELELHLEGDGKNNVHELKQV